MTHKRKSTKPWVIARTEPGNCRADRYFDNEEQAKQDFEENRDYHIMHGHKIMLAKDYYEYAKNNK